MLALALLGTGCRLTGPDRRYDLIEAELRARDRELAEARGELNRLRVLEGVYGRQPPATIYRPDCPPAGSFRQAGATPTAPLKDILLASGTGGVDEDNRPGDEYLQVVIAPRDDDGTTVKVPMRAVVRAYEVAPDGLKTVVGQWAVSADQMRRSWKSGLISSGYFVPLQWDRAPATTRLRVVTRAQTLDGREFEADKEVNIKPLPQAASGQPPLGPVNELPLPATLPPRPDGSPAPPAPALPVPPTSGPEELPPPARLRYRPSAAE